MKHGISSRITYLLLGAGLWACSSNDNVGNASEEYGYTSPSRAVETQAGGEMAPPPAMDSVAGIGEESKDADDVTRAEGFLSSSAATMPKDTAKRFILTADLRYEVKDVRTATLQTEAVIAQFDGWVTHTHLQSEVTRTLNTPVSADSSLEEKFYVVRNYMVLRVPNQNLDTTLKVLSRMIDYLDYRTIDAEDVSLRMMFEALRQKRNDEFNRRIGNAVDEKGNKLNQIADAEERRLNAQERADEALRNRLAIADKVQYSTISLNIYQRETVRRTMVPNYKNIDAYRPGFFSRLGDAFVSGWNGFLQLLVGLATLWPLLLVIGGVVFLVRWLLRRGRKGGN